MNGMHATLDEVTASQLMEGLGLGLGAIVVRVRGLKCYLLL